MSSSDRGGLTGAQFFVPDLPGGRVVEFVADSAASHVPAGGEGVALSLEEYAEGPSPEQIREESRQQAQREFEEVLAMERAADRQQLEALVGQVRVQMEEREDRLARQCVQLAITVAERLVRDRIDRDPEVIERVVRDAVKGMDASGSTIVFVHAEDVAVLEANAALLSELGIAEVRADPRQRRGGCRLELDDRAWDASLVGQLARLQDALEKVLERES